MSGDSQSPTFEQFIGQYPGGLSRGSPTRARLIWERLSVEERTAALAGLPAWIGSDQWHRGFVQNPETWLHEAKWLVEPPPAAQPSPRSESEQAWDEFSKRVSQRVSYVDAVARLEAEGAEEPDAMAASFVVAGASLRRAGEVR